MLAKTDPAVAIAEGDRSYGHREHIEQLVEDCLEELDPPDELLEPGDRVLVKPNWALDLDPDLDEDEPQPWEHKITHPAIIEATVRWAAKQLNGNGSILIADAPRVPTPFSVIDEMTGLSKIPGRCAADFPGVVISLADYRTAGGSGPEGDPTGLSEVALGEASEFDGLRLPKAYLQAGQVYRFWRSALSADVLINLPKLKTHSKLGLTGALHNVLGLLDDRGALPMNPLAVDETNADLEEEDLDDRLISWLRRKFRHSRLVQRLLLRSRQALNEKEATPEKHESWHGNDLFWRLVLDLNKALFYYDGQGERRTRPLRSLHLIDAVIGGEGNGPVHSDAKPSGILMAGTHPLAVDCAAAELMGFDWRKIRLLRNAFRARQLPLAEFAPEDMRCISEHPPWDGPLEEFSDPVEYHPHDGWWGDIEKEMAEENAGQN
ncbi:MAG: DUF362 domain-containing protein, partial [Verrucomicrobiota bacterium]